MAACTRARRCGGTIPRSSSEDIGMKRGWRQMIGQRQGEFMFGRQAFGDVRVLKITRQVRTGGFVPQNGVDGFRQISCRIAKSLGGCFFLDEPGQIGGVNKGLLHEDVQRRGLTDDVSRRISPYHPVAGPDQAARVRRCRK